MAVLGPHKNYQGITSEVRGKIHDALVANLQRLGGDVPPAFMAYAEGLLLGMGPEDRAKALDGLINNPQASTAAITLARETAAVEQLQTEAQAKINDAQRKKQLEALAAAEPKDKLADLIKFMKTQNKTSSALVAAAVAFLGGSDKLSEAWERYAHNRSQYEAAAILMAWASGDAVYSMTGNRVQTASYSFDAISSNGFSGTASARYQNSFPWSERYERPADYEPNTTWGNDPQQTFRAIPAANQPLVQTIVEQERARIAERTGLPLSQITPTPLLHFNGVTKPLEDIVVIRKNRNDDQKAIGLRDQGDDKSEPGTFWRMVYAAPNLFNVDKDTQQRAANEFNRGFQNIPSSIVRRTGIVVNYLKSLNPFAEKQTDEQRQKAHDEFVKWSHQVGRNFRIGFTDYVTSPLKKYVFKPIGDNVVVPLVKGVKDYVVAPINNYVVTPTVNFAKDYVINPVANTAKSLGSWIYEKAYGKTEPTPTAPAVEAVPVATAEPGMFSRATNYVTSTASGWYNWAVGNKPPAEPPKVDTAVGVGVPAGPAQVVKVPQGQNVTPEPLKVVTADGIVNGTATVAGSVAAQVVTTAGVIKDVTAPVVTADVVALQNETRPRSSTVFKEIMTPKKTVDELKAELAQRSAEDRERLAKAVEKEGAANKNVAEATLPKTEVEKKEKAPEVAAAAPTAKKEPSKDEKVVAAATPPAVKAKAAAPA
ncbi:MAG: hypothetical protein K2Q32_07425 [Alphaproteobacteria bacterium]|nr:hypothetical protein [Alphaproteobacteria bacterium]